MAGAAASTSRRNHRQRNLAQHCEHHANAANTFGGGINIGSTYANTVTLTGTTVGGSAANQNTAAANSNSLFRREDKALVPCL